MHCQTRHTLLPLVLLLLLVLSACKEEHEHTAPAVRDRDSVATMTSYGVNTLISDSGITKYRIVAERWEVNDKRNPSRWIFDKGILLTQFDLKKHVLGYISCDTAYYFDQERIWELHGRVHILTKDTVEFRGEELYWDEDEHEIWSHQYCRVTSPDREMEGTWFKSDETMTRYEIRMAKGSFERNDMGREKPQTIVRDTTRKDSTHRPPMKQVPMKQVPAKSLSTMKPKPLKPLKPFKLQHAK